MSIEELAAIGIYVDEPLPSAFDEDLLDDDDRQELNFNDN